MDSSCPDSRVGIIEGGKSDAQKVILVILQGWRDWGGGGGGVEGV